MLKTFWIKHLENKSKNECLFAQQALLLQRRIVPTKLTRFDSITAIETTHATAMILHPETVPRRQALGYRHGQIPTKTRGCFRMLWAGGLELAEG
eukprot:s45_g34.t1